LGDHNVANALAASLAAQSFGAETEVIRRALAGYEALPHRLRAVATVGGVRWINDSKATNPNAAGAALRSMVAPTILLAGGSVKEADFRELGTLISERTKAVILFGETREALAAAISASHPTLIVSGIEEAVAQARRLAESGDVVLLSPACASYDQFRSYAHRGEVFEALVRGLRS
jgi:UDP-N-acetylmuramoylalanine--D-glutamate ligase